VRLLAALDERHQAFVAALAAPLRRLALRRGTYTGEPGEEPFAGPSSMNPGVTLTPWLFWEISSALDDAEFLDLAEAGSRIVLASALLDHLVDGQADSPDDAILFHHLLHQTGLAQLRARLGGRPAFWATCDRLVREHIEGLAAESALRTDPKRFSFPEFERMVRAKFSPIVLTMAAFLAAVDRFDLLGAIEISIKDLAVASQALDDIGDWEEDHAARRMTYFLSCVGATLPAGARLDVPAGDVRAAIQSSWIDVDHLNLAREWLERAQVAVGGVPCPGWVEYLGDFQALAAEHLQQSTAAHLARSLEPLLGSRRGDPPGAGESVHGPSGS
jgi:hypothetical protein